jgi:hypothetical protein
MRLQNVSPRRCSTRTPVGAAFKRFAKSKRDFTLFLPAQPPIGKTLVNPLVFTSAPFLLCLWLRP